MKWKTYVSEMLRRKYRAEMERTSSRRTMRTQKLMLAWAVAYAAIFAFWWTTMYLSMK